MHSTPNQAEWWSHDELVIPLNRGKLAMMAVGSLLFAVTSAWMVSLARDEGLMAIVALGASAAFFALCGVAMAWRLLRNTPAVVIDRHGILDDASGVAVGFVRWEEIAEIREYESSGQKFLSIRPTSLERLLQKQPAWKRALIRANLRMGASAINIPLGVLPPAASTLLQEVLRRRPTPPRAANARRGVRTGSRLRTRHREPHG